MRFNVNAALLKIEGVTPAKTANSAKLNGNQPKTDESLAALASLAAPHGDISFSVNTADIEFQERAGIISCNGIPEDWVHGFAVLVSMPLPTDWPQARWDRILINAESFLAEWGVQAHRLGWTVNDLFGVSLAGSEARLDRMGLIIMLGDCRVTAMTDETASLQCLHPRTGQPTGSNQTFYRKPDMSQSVPLWNLQATPNIETGE